jgi:hypothetical protein
MQLMKEDRAVLIQFRGEAGDRNPFGMTDAVLLGNALANRCALEPIIAEPQLCSSNGRYARSGTGAETSARPLVDALASHRTDSRRLEFPPLHEHV